MTISQDVMPNTSHPPLSQPATAADLIIQYLQQLDVEYVFGIPGGAIEPFYNALARSERAGGPRSVTVRHETGGAFIADGYAWQAGTLGVCCATTGPGTTNLITGVASAYANHTPMLVITGQTPLSTFGRQAFQESSCTGINTLAMLEPCTRYNSLVSHPNQLELKLVNAITTAMGQTPGPVHLSIPVDIMASTAVGTSPQYNLRDLIRPIPSASAEDIQRLAARLHQARRMVFVLGEGAAQAIGNIVTIAQLFNAEIVTTPQGKGLVSPYHPAFRGVYGFAGHSSAYQALTSPEVDTIVCVGTVLSEWASNSWDKDTLMNERLVHIEEWEQNLLLTPMANLQIRGKIDHVFNGLLQYLSQQGELPEQMEPAEDHLNSHQLPFSVEDKQGYQSNASPIHPARLMRELTEILPNNTRYIPEPGNSFAWAIHYLHPYDRRLKGLRQAQGGLFRTCIEFASMGWAIGSSVGTALALRDQPVVCISGDGSMLMSGQEITVAVEQQLPMIFIVLNDHALGMVKHGQQLTGAEPIGYQITGVDFAQFAEAMGVKGIRIESPKDLEQLKTIDFRNLQGPLLLDVLIDGNAVPPIGNRTEALKKQARQALEAHA